jgi:hypothetical protein
MRRARAFAPRSTGKGAAHCILERMKAFLLGEKLADERLEVDLP